jgi:hypothetical protein
MSRRHHELIGVLVGLAASIAPSEGHPRFERLLSLQPGEGVFAYARISPDGRLLVYASETRDPQNLATIVQTETLVDLRQRRVLFTEPGVDAYWSPDGSRMIYQGSMKRPWTVNVLHLASGAITRDVAPVELGDYFSWGQRDGKALVLTIKSNYFYLDGDRAVLPATRVPSCKGIGTGERPLLSKDGKRITTFVRGTIVVRNLTDCRDIVEVGLQGAKADFSWDGRYLAFHAPRANGNGYDLQVVDLNDRTVRTITAGLPGSSYFPSWTRDGRLCFHYSGDDYRGFMMASNVLAAPATPLPSSRRRVPLARSWPDAFPETPLPPHRLNAVLIWSTWSAHAPTALEEMQRARDSLHRRGVDLGWFTAVESGSREEEVQAMLRSHAITIPRIPLAPGRLLRTEAVNQIPATLVFRDGHLVARRLGAQTTSELEAWLSRLQTSTTTDPGSEDSNELR